MPYEKRNQTASVHAPVGARFYSKRQNGFELMIPYGSAKRFYIGGLVLAAILLTGYNVFHTASLFSPPLVGRSEETRLVSSKWLKLGNKLSLISEETFEDVDFETIALRFREEIPVVAEELPQPQTEIATAEIKEQKVVEIEPILPVVDGVIEISETQDRRRFFALIEGRRVMENDNFNGFAIAKISQKGIVLIRDSRTWFVPTPMVYFSLDRER